MFRTSCIIVALILTVSTVSAQSNCSIAPNIGKILDHLYTSWDSIVINPDAMRPVRYELLYCLKDSADFRKTSNLLLDDKTWEISFSSNGGSSTKTNTTGTTLQKIPQEVNEITSIKASREKYGAMKLQHRTDSIMTNKVKMGQQVVALYFTRQKKTMRFIMVVDGAFVAYSTFDLVTAHDKIRNTHSKAFLTFP